MNSSMENRSTTRPSIPAFRQFFSDNFILSENVNPMPNPLIRLRTSLGLGQTDLARLLGISRSHLAMMETGKAAPKGTAEVYLFQAERFIPKSAVGM